jgi:hypothetical protein
MANYILSLDKGKENFEEINWNKIPEFSSLNNHSLNDVDSFTTSFKTAEDLKETLIKNSLMNLDDYNKKLCIRYKSRGKMKKLEYGVAYTDDKMFLDEVYAAYYLESNSNNLELLDKLCNHYRNSYIQGSNINAIRNYINSVRNNVELWPEDINHIHGCLKDFIIREVYSYDASTYTYKVDKSGNPLLKYKGLHDLGMFFAYDKRKKLKKELENESIKQEQTVMKIIPEEKQKVKVKSSKKDPIPGQLSFFD